jgi:two-component system, chemotaxis family, chemotaxis protein CheY
VKSVLIVEDSSTTRSMIRAAVEEAGEELNAVEASSGFEALKLLPREDYALIVTDINMPGINGLELINFIRKDERYRHIPLVIVTTERSAEDRDRGLAMGADAYVSKPFKEEDLREVITRILCR